MEKAISQNSMISLGLAIVAATVVFSFGVTYERVSSLKNEISGIKQQIFALDIKIDKLLSQKLSLNR